MQPTVLMTGATGLLGRSCLPHMRKRHGSEQILALVRPGRDVSLLAAAGIATVEGDIAEPDLGLSEERYRTLTSQVQFIVHCAADIRFNISLEESRRTNVGGTQNLLRFANRCARIEKFAHMSTAYVSGGRNGHILEEIAEPGRFFNPYQQSKFEAEQAVLDAMGRVPATIYRFSTMIYDGISERVGQFNYFHQLLRLALINPLHMVPADPDAPIDLILSDWAARAFAFLFEDHFRPGEFVHICAGRERSLTVSELFETTFDSLPVKGRRPSLVDQRYFDRHLNSILSTASRRQMWRSLTHFLPHMNVAQTFDTAKLRLGPRGREELKLADMRGVLPKVLSYCMSTNWGTTQPG
jgi:nucleoside-diphosphate-sugar epimerase